MNIRQLQFFCQCSGNGLLLRGRANRIGHRAGGIQSGSRARAGDRRETVPADGQRNPPRARRRTPPRSGARGRTRASSASRGRHRTFAGNRRRRAGFISRSLLSPVCQARDDLQHNLTARKHLHRSRCAARHLLGGRASPRWNQGSSTPSSPSGGSMPPGSRAPRWGRSPSASSGEAASAPPQEDAVVLGPRAVPRALREGDRRLGQRPQTLPGPGASFSASARSRPTRRSWNSSSTRRASSQACT